MPICMNAKHYFRSALFGLLICLFLTSQAWAAAYTWDGGAGTNNWVDGDNWDPNIPGGPGAGDDVTFNADQTVVLAGIDTVVQSLTISTANITFNGYLEPTILTVDQDTTITILGGLNKLREIDSFVYGANDVVLSGPGSFTFQAANAISGTGSIELQNNALFAIENDQTIRMPDAAHGAGTNINLLNASVLTIYHAGAGLNYQGTILGTGGIQIQGGGTVALSGNNTYGGPTTVNAGTLSATGAGNQLPAGTALTVNATGTCEMDDQTVSSISGSGTIQINAGGDLTVNEAGTGSFSGPITGAAANFISMSGAGTLTLSGAVAPPVQVNNGILVFNGTAAQNIDLIAGTLLGVGTCNGALDTAAGTTFGPGNSIGTFNAAGGFNLGAGSTLAIEVSGASGDQVNVTGAVDLNVANISITGTPYIGSTFTIVNNDGVDPIVSVFAGAEIEGAVFPRGGHDYQITYVGGDGNDVVLTALTGTDPPSPDPEPTPDPDPEPTPAPRPAPVVGPENSPSPTGSLNGPVISWPKVGGTNHYNVYRADCPTCPKTQVARVPGTSFTDETAIPGLVYYYFVRSDNGALSGYSNWIPAWRYEQNPGRGGDFNGDGVMDLLWWDPDSNQLSIWLMNGGAVQSVSAVGQGLDIGQWLLMNTGDFNGDGIWDLMWWNPATGEAVLWYLSAQSASAGGDAFNAAAVEGIVGNATLSYAGDLNGDDRADFMWRDYATGEVTIWLTGEDGAPNFNGPPALAEGMNDGNKPGITDSLEWTLRGLYDMNADHKADVVWQHGSDGRVVVWLMDGAEVVGIAEFQRVEPDNWRIAGMGDLNGDGLGDIVWRNDATGQVQIWLMADGDPAYEERIISLGDDALNWHVKAVGEFRAAGVHDAYCLHVDSAEARILTLEGEDYYPKVE